MTVSSFLLLRLRPSSELLRLLGLDVLNVLGLGIIALLLLLLLLLLLSRRLHSPPVMCTLRDG